MNHHNGQANNGRAPQPYEHTRRPAPPAAAPTDELTAVWEQRAQELAIPPQEDVSGSTTVDTLVFTLGEEKYGIDVSYVSKIYPLGRITAVPRTPPFVIGIFSARGRLVSIIDLYTLWGMSSMEVTSDSKIIVLVDDQSGMEVGILADSVQDVVAIFKDELDPTLTGQTDQRAGCTQGIAPGMIIVLNPAVLLQDEALVVQEEII